MWTYVLLRHRGFRAGPSRIHFDRCQEGSRREQHECDQTLPLQEPSVGFTAKAGRQSQAPTFRLEWLI